MHNLPKSHLPSMQPSDLNVEPQARGHPQLLLLALVQATKIKPCIRG